ncbi:MAG: DUF2330 domain-containing protein, partial [Deltaproteobacteria bacterium]|nr:DUF2330 domain-containing protein [Deltaproteobacteria bacterium]
MVRTLFAMVMAMALIPTSAEAFCGFYVGGADSKLFNNATQVVMMREGSRTVLSMANNYQGPAADFAMVVPVPQVLQKANVKTLDPSVFDRIDTLGAPRLVEYYEQDPCPKPRPSYDRMKAPSARASGMRRARRPAPMKKAKVKIEAQFKVGEYDIVILSATDSSALDVWLRQNGYKIPRGAEKVLRPYVASGMKFFVAKVDIKKVRYDASGKTMLSPLRFHYDTDTFSLPVRLGLLNSGGEQDLIVNILAKGKRYEVANYRNVFIPTNLRVREKVISEFGPFYASLFDSVMRRNRGAVVTEYSWQASGCDPCPGGMSGLSFRDLQTLGADVIGGGGLQVAGPRGKRRAMPRPRRRRPPMGGNAGAFVLTRLHTRYTKKSLGRDLVFRAARPVVGGRGSYQGKRLPHGAKTASFNNFQGRYYILHRWKGAV